jgi:hypothetical protein
MSTKKIHHGGTENREDTEKNFLRAFARKPFLPFSSPFLSVAPWCILSSLHSRRNQTTAESGR